MSQPADLLSFLESPVLQELATAVTTLLDGDTITQRNSEDVRRLTGSVVRAPMSVVNDLVVSAVQSETALERMSEAYDEKEFWLRIFLKTAANFSLRLHVWLPAPPDAVGVETVHSHRRYLISTLLNNQYTVFHYRTQSDQAVELTGTRTVLAGTCYTITPDTIHAVSNQTDKHTMSLIVRGNAVTSEIRFFDHDAQALVPHVSRRPIGALGKTPEELAMSRKAYLRYRLQRLAADCGLAVPA